MVKVLSWMIVICIVLFILGAFITPFATVSIAELYFPIIIAIGAISAIALVITLIFERIRDRKEEKDDLSKY